MLHSVDVLQRRTLFNPLGRRAAFDIWIESLENGIFWRLALSSADSLKLRNTLEMLGPYRRLRLVEQELMRDELSLDDQDEE